MPSTSVSAADVLVEYYARLDGDAAGDPLALVTDDYRFAMDLVGDEVPSGHIHNEGDRETMRG
jgi:hypothetical protein